MYHIIIQSNVHKSEVHGEVNGAPWGEDPSDRNVPISADLKVGTFTCRGNNTQIKMALLCMCYCYIKAKSIYMVFIWYTVSTTADGSECVQHCALCICEHFMHSPEKI